MKVISFFNLKGGCGKTTSVVNLGYLLAEDLKEKNGKVLLVDLDMQANLTNSLMDYDFESISAAACESTQLRGAVPADRSAGTAPLLSLFFCRCSRRYLTSDPR